MSYSVGYKPERYHVIQRFIDDIMALPEGETVTWSDIPVGVIGRLRSLLYDWRNAIGMSDLIKIRVRHTSLSVTKRENLGELPVKKVVTQKQRVRQLDVYYDLVDKMESLEEVKEKIAKWIREEEINYTEAADIDHYAKQTK